MQAMSIIVGALRGKRACSTRRLQGSRAIPDGHAKDPRSVLVGSGPGCDVRGVSNINDVDPALLCMTPMVGSLR
jgi:hypothetical protein